jgi:peptidoglycan/xylan/chitin deacetylase (PgdA/CDA1 family)
MNRVNQTLQTCMSKIKQKHRRGGANCSNQPSFWVLDPIGMKVSYSMREGRRERRRVSAAKAAVLLLVAGGLAACQNTGRVRSGGVAPTPAADRSAGAGGSPDATTRPQGRSSGASAAARGGATPASRPQAQATTVPASPPAGGSPPPRGRGGLPPVVTKIKTKDRVVFITIDDGWEKDPRFLTQVRDQRIPITIFLTNAAARPAYEYFRALQQTGAPIENHTTTQAFLVGLPAGGQRAQICPVQDIYARVYGARPTLFRPPYGAYDKTTRKVAASCGIQAIVNWTTEYRSQTRRMYYQGPRRLHRGDIILWHFKPDMPQNFAKLLRIIRKQHLHPAPLQNYLAGRFSNGPRQTGHQH